MIIFFEAFIYLAIITGHLEHSAIMSADLYTFIKQSGLNDPVTRLSGDQVPIFEEEEVVLLSAHSTPGTFPHFWCRSETVLLYMFLRL